MRRSPSRSNRQVRSWLLLGALSALLAAPAPAPTAGAQAGGPAAECAALGYDTFDLFPSIGVAAFDVDLRGVLGVPVPPFLPLPEPPFVVRLDEGAGDTVVCRTDPIPDECETGCTIETEIIRMELRGTLPGVGPVTVRESPHARSQGVITGASVDPLDNVPFGGFSFFDVFIDVEIGTPGGTLVATTCLDPNQPFSFFCQAFRVTADLTDVKLPPVHDVSYNHPYGEPVDLWVDPDPADPEGEFIVGRLLSGCHKPYEVGTGDEHYTCVLGFGGVTPDGFGDDCLENNVQLLAIDASRPGHDLLFVSSTTTGPLTVTPWAPVAVNGVQGWTAFAVTLVEQCADVGVTLSGIYGDLHAASAKAAWRQHA